MKRNGPPARAWRSLHLASIGARKIFIIKRVSRLQIADTKNTIIQRILIFDDHPDSLRLIFGRRPSPQSDRTTPAKWWELPLGWMLIMCALLVLVLPLFLKLPS